MERKSEETFNGKCKGKKKYEPPKISERKTFEKMMESSELRYDFI